MDHNRTLCKGSESGTVLLAILWLGVTLSLLVFSTAHLVRSDSFAIVNRQQSQQAYFIARGGIYRAIYEVGQVARNGSKGDSSSVLDKYSVGKNWMQFNYSKGSALIQVIPENSKIAVNSASPETLESLFQELNQSSSDSKALAQAIVEWRSPRSSDVDTPLDQFYASQQPPYRANHRTIEDMEELLGVRGVTRNLYYGDLIAGVKPCLVDVLSVELAQGQINVNSARLEVLAALPGWDRSLARQVIDARRDQELVSSPYKARDDLVGRVPGIANVVGISPITFYEGRTYTIISTGILETSPIRKTVRSLVRFDSSVSDGYRILGWWDEWPWSPPPDSIISAVQEKL